jgi:benzodiazapine receptor
MSITSTSSILKITNIVAFAIVVIVNSFAGAVGLNGYLTGQISDLYPNLFVPAGITFSVWGAIYLLLGLFVVFQALPSTKNSPFQKKIGYLFILSCIFNIAWLISWHWSYLPLSVVVMFALLATLIAIYLRLDIGRGSASRMERLFVWLPFSVYLGWITVAPIANVTAALVSIGWNGLGLSNVTWTVLVLAVALVITLAVIFTRKDIGYSAVIVWALLGIWLKQSAISEIALTTEICAIIIVLALVVVYLMPRLRSSK